MGIDVAIIGSGRWGKNHINTVNQNAKNLGIEDIYVCDIDAEKLIQWEDEPLKCFTSIEEILVDHKPSFAVVATPQRHILRSPKLYSNKVSACWWRNR